VPHLFITGYGTVEVRRPLLGLHEVAAVLDTDIHQIRNMVRRGDLTNASADHRRWVDATELLDLIERGVGDDTLSPLCRVRLARLVATAPRTGDRTL